MAWQSHFSFKVEFQGPVGPATTWDKTLPIPKDIPFDEILGFKDGIPTSQDRKALSLNHRKVLWAYENINRSVWTQAARELATLIQKHPAHTLTVKTSQAGVGVVLAMLAGHKLPYGKTVHFSFESAPLAWLESHFSSFSSAYSVEYNQDPSCAWSHCSGLVTPARRAA